jgi:integrase
VPIGWRFTSDCKPQSRCGIIRTKLGRLTATGCSNFKPTPKASLLEPPYDLVAKLLYGCGLRLFECLKLRVQDLSFDLQVLTVHDGKGLKDRTLPMPALLKRAS